MTATDTLTAGRYQVEGVAFVVRPATRGIHIAKVTPAGREVVVAGIRTTGTRQGLYFRAEGATARRQVTALLADTAAARVATCSRCGAVLTDPESIARRRGPECTAKAA